MLLNAGGAGSTVLLPPLPAAFFELLTGTTFAALVLTFGAGAGETAKPCAAGGARGTVPFPEPFSTGVGLIFSLSCCKSILLLGLPYGIFTGGT